MSRRNRDVSIDESNVQSEKQRIRNRSAVEINSRSETRKLVAINKFEGALKNVTIHQSIRASEKLQEEKRKRELVNIYWKLDG